MRVSATHRSWTPPVLLLLTLAFALIGWELLSGSNDLNLTNGFGNVAIGVDGAGIHGAGLESVSVSPTASVPTNATS